MDSKLKTVPRELRVRKAVQILLKKLNVCPQLSCWKLDFLTNMHDLLIIHLVPKDSGREKDEAWIVEQASSSDIKSGFAFHLNVLGALYNTWGGPD